MWKWFNNLSDVGKVLVVLSCLFVLLGIIYGISQVPGCEKAPAHVAAGAIPVGDDNLLVVRSIHTRSYFNIFCENYEGDTLIVPAALEHDKARGYEIVITGDAFRMRAREVIENLREGNAYIWLRPGADKHPRFGEDLRRRRPYPVSWGETSPVDGKTRRIVVDDPDFIKTCRRGEVQPKKDKATDWSADPDDPLPSWYQKK